MKNWVLLTVLFLAFQVNAHALNLDSYIDDTGHYAYQQAGAGSTEEYYTISHSDQYIGGVASGDDTANAFQFTITQALKINHLSIDAVASPGGAFGPPDTSISLPVLFQIYGASRPGPVDTGIVPNTNSLIFSSKTTLFSSNVESDTVYTDKHVSFKTTLQPGTYWFVDEITPPKEGGALVDLQSVNFVGKVVSTPEPGMWLFFVFLVLLVFFKGFYSRSRSA